MLISRFFTQFCRIACMLVFAGAWNMASAADEISGSWTNGPTSKVIEMHARLSGKEVVIASTAVPRASQTVTLGAFSDQKEAVLKLIREKVAEQTGIMINEVGDQVSITYNDQLQIKRVTPPARAKTP